MVLLFLLLVFFAWTVIGFMGKLESTAENRRLAQEKVNELKKQKEDLSSEITRLGTQSGVEADIREKFGLAKPGEGVIVIVDDKSASSAEAMPKQSGFWDFLSNLFK